MPYAGRFIPSYSVTVPSVACLQVRLYDLAVVRKASAGCISQLPRLRADDVEAHMAASQLAGAAKLDAFSSPGGGADQGAPAALGSPAGGKATELAWTSALNTGGARSPLSAKKKVRPAAAAAAALRFLMPLG